jgi:hypothetical protein
MSASKRPRSTFTVGLREMSWTGIHQLTGAAIARLPRDRSRRIQEIEVWQTNSRRGVRRCDN